MPAGGFINARLRLRLPRPSHTRADPVARVWMHRSPVASHNVYDVLDLDMGDNDSGVVDLDGSPLTPAVLMVMPTLDETANSAMDTLNSNRCTTLALTNADMFAGPSNTAYLDSGNQLSAVL
jgi:hypothetical protein